MRVENKNHTQFSGLTTFVENRVLINKAIVDLAVDVPVVLKANNANERRERFSRAAIGWTIAFATPFITLPISNRLALKYITGTYKNFFGKENKIIEISNKYLKTEQTTKNEILKLAGKYKFNAEEMIEKCGGWQGLRKKIITAKNTVLGLDYLFTAGMLGSIGFFNNYITKQKTGRKGFSAEFNMAEAEITDRRASKYEKTEKIRKASFYGVLAILAASPLFIRKGLISNSQKGISGFFNKHAQKFDYKDGIFMNRVPLFMSLLAAYFGVSMASRNRTEMKDNLVRAGVAQTVFFGGDILIGSLLARISDKFLKTNIIDKNAPKTILNKLVPPYKKVCELTGRSKKIASAAFWINIASLSAILGYTVPTLLNKMIKSDVKKDADKINSAPFQQYHLNEFLKS